MKILIFGLHRTRSQLLLEAICNYYQIYNNKENWIWIAGKFSGPQLKNNKDLDTKFNLFQKEFKQMVELSFTNNFASKLLPRMLFFGSNIADENFFINHKIVNNLTYFLNLKKIDKIYVLDRNLTDSACSYMYGLEINQFTFRDVDNLNYKIQNTGNICIDINNNELKLHILESAFLFYLKQFLKNNYIITELTYDNIPEYISKTFSSTKVEILKTNINYKETITNYDEVKMFVENYYTKCVELLKPLNFQ